jgi:excisionase family DNA binding protein
MTRPPNRSEQAQNRPEQEALLTPSEVATLFRVDPKTVTRWAQTGKVASLRTLGGHRRYRESDIRALLEGQSTAASAGPTGPTGPTVPAGPAKPR